jgi:nucleotide-binding universal stress UspA family protein
LPLELLVAEGDSAESLVAAAEGAGLLVVGARGRSPFAGLMLGSVSQRCAAKAGCPVVIVKLDTDMVDDTEARVAE